MSSRQWDISIGNYASKSLSVTTQDIYPNAVAMSPDGTKAYVPGSNTSYVYQYTLSTPWDISTGSYSSKSMYVGGQDASPYGLAFSPDGTKCFIMGRANSRVFQYTLSVAWDISTGSYASKSMSVGSQSINTLGMDMSADGAKCYVVGYSTKSVYQYDLSVAWDISTGTYASKYLDATTQQPGLSDVTFSADGTKCYIIGSSPAGINQYTLSVAWDISTGTYASKFMSTAEDTSPGGTAFKPDGSKCFVMGKTNDTIYQYSVVQYDLTGTVRDPYGTVMANADVKVLGLTDTSWSLSVGMYDSKSLSTNTQDAFPSGLAFSSDGTKAYVVGIGSTTLYQYTLSTAWDLSTGTYASKSMSVSAQEGNPISLAFSSDGTKCYVLGYFNDAVFQYTLSTPWDISTGSYSSKSMYVGTQENTPYALAFSADGTKCYVAGAGQPFVFQYTLSTAWDISTGSYASVTASVGPESSTTTGLAFSVDGLNMFTIGFVPKDVFRYSLSTAWDLGSALYASDSVYINAEDTNPRGLAFSPDGEKFYITGDNSAQIYQYTLIVPTVKESLTANGSGVYTYSSNNVETDLQAVAFTPGPPRRFGATDNNLSTS